MHTYLDMQALHALSHAVTHRHTRTLRQSISLHTAKDQRLLWRDGGTVNKYNVRERA